MREHACDGGCCGLPRYGRLVAVKPLIANGVFTDAEFKDQPSEVLESNGFKAVTSTAGVKAFKKDWAKEFENIPEVYICFDNDDPGRNGALRVGQIIPHAKIVELPAEVGDGGDVTDFFVRLGKSREDFLKLLEEAKPAPAAPETPVIAKTRNGDSRQRIERAKNDNPIVEVIGRYMELRSAGTNLVGLCPFQDASINRTLA